MRTWIKVWPGGARIVPIAFAAALSFVPTDWATAQSSSANYKLPISLLNSGVDTVTSTNFKLSSSLGDPFFTGPSTSTNYHMAHGLWISTAGPAPVLVSAVSRRHHGAAGDFDLPLASNPLNPTTEPRQGPAQAIVFTFDKPITGAVAAITEGAAVTAAPTFSGNTVVVGLTSVTDQQYVTVSLTAVASSDGGSGGTGAARVGFLMGDVNQSRVVTVGDLGLVNAQLAQPVTAANYLKDVNASGTLTLADKGLTNTNLTRALPPP
jgi:hypothetical protein